MCTFKYFLRWYNNKNVAPTLEVLQKVVDFFHIKKMKSWSSDVLCQILEVFVFTNQPIQSFIPSQRAREICWRNYAETWLVDHPWYLIGKLLWARPFFRDSSNWCKTNVGTDACQLYPYSSKWLGRSGGEGDGRPCMCYDSVQAPDPELVGFSIYVLINAIVRQSLRTGCGFSTIGFSSV